MFGTGGQLGRELGDALMRSLVQAFILGGYVLAIVLGLGYAWLMARKPGERKVLFAAAWLSITVALAAAFRLWGEAHVLRYFADITVDSQLAKRPGMRALSGRHPEVRAWLEQVALVALSGHDTTDDAFTAAFTAYASSMQRYELAYLAIAADKQLMSYAGALASTISRLNDRSGFICGAFLKEDYARIVRAMSARVSEDDFMNARDAAFLSAFEQPHALLSAQRISEVDTNLMQFLERRYGPLQAKVLLNAMDASAPADDPELCTAMVVSIEYALALPSPDREDTIRAIFQAAANELPDEEPRTDASAPLKL